MDTTPESRAMKKALGARIAELRRAADPRITQEELARRVGITVSMLSMTERGDREPSLPTLIRLAAALGVEPCELFSESEPVLRPVLAFVRARGLTAEDVRRLVDVAKTVILDRPQPPSIAAERVWNRKTR